MALDGIFLSKVCDELKKYALSLRVDKVQQPSRDEVVLVLRGKSGFNRVVKSAAHRLCLGFGGGKEQSAIVISKHIRARRKNTVERARVINI